MADKTLGVVESKFADIIWSKEPLSSSELSKLAEKELGWKREISFAELVERMVKNDIALVEKEIKVSKIG
jgi:hypothetical protein